MSWRERAGALGWDEETQAFMEISAHFLCVYFSHSEEGAERVLEGFLERYGGEFFEDWVHQLGAYPFAAACHYLVHLNGDRNRLGDWLRESGHQRAPDAALEVFRQRYFNR